VKVTAILTERCHLKCDFCRSGRRRERRRERRLARFFRANRFLRWVNLSAASSSPSRAPLARAARRIVAALPRLELLDFPTAASDPSEVEAAVRALLATRLPRLASR
jgi:hypothetical protein